MYYLSTLRLALIFIAVLAIALLVESKPIEEEVTVVSVQDDIVPPTTESEALADGTEATDIPLPLAPGGKGLKFDEKSSVSIEITIWRFGI
jgi:hypothetical protein